MSSTARYFRAGVAASTIRREYHITSRLSLLRDSLYPTKPEHVQSINSS